MDLPFSFDKIAAGSSILGRSAEIGTLVATLEKGGRSLAVYGEARSGKETVVTEALEQIRARGNRLIVCYIDLFNIRTAEDFYQLWRERMKECAVEVNRDALLPFDIHIDDISTGKLFDLPGIIADEAAIGMVNQKTTAVRLVPVPGKGVGEWVEFGGLLGRAPIIPVHKESADLFIARGGRIPALTGR